MEFEVVRTWKRFWTIGTLVEIFVWTTLRLLVERGLFDRIAVALMEVCFDF